MLGSREASEDSAQVTLTRDRKRGIDLDTAMVVL